MKVILDENLPKPLKGIFSNHSVTTVQEQGLAGTLNGALLARLDGLFDVFITADKNLRYQQNLRDARSPSWSFPPTGLRSSARWLTGLRLRSMPSGPESMCS